MPPHPYRTAPAPLTGDRAHPVLRVVVATLTIALAWLALTSVLAHLGVYWPSP